MFKLQLGPAEGKFCPFTLADADIVQVLVELALVHNRANLAVSRQSMADLQSLKLFDDRLHEAIMDTGLDDQPA